jgi:hypothetical protein
MQSALHVLSQTIRDLSHRSARNKFKSFSRFFAEGMDVMRITKVLKNPKLEGDTLALNLQTLEGDLTGGDGAAAYAAPCAHARPACGYYPQRPRY